MKEPPNSRKRGELRNGQPIVWMTRSSGRGTFHTSFTPRAHTCGFSPASPKRSSAAPVRCPCVPSASTVTRATMSEPGSKLASCSPSRPLPLLEHGDGNVAEPLRRLRLLLEQLPEPDRAREPGRPRADDQDTDLDPLVLGIGRLADRFSPRERRRIIRRAAHDFRCLTSSVSFGTIVCRSPTTPRSANSKIGAFASLLIATIVPELCMPTLCWIAPEMPTATYSLGD